MSFHKYFRRMTGFIIMLSLLFRDISLIPSSVILTDSFATLKKSNVDKRTCNIADETGVITELDDEAGKQKYYPLKKVFDGGDLIIRFGDQVSEEKINRLYWSTKEVRAQFYRAIGTDEPVDAGNKNDVLTVVIFNNKEAYEAYSALNHTPSDPNGLYREEQNILYTWDRVVSEDSNLELEELFRSEFAHYLHSRYIVPRVWGQSERYKNNCLAWFQEGCADYFAGSTRLEGVKPRKTIYQKISQYPQAECFNLGDIIGVSYEPNWNFPNFACIYIDYMNTKNWEMMHLFSTFIRGNQEMLLDQMMKIYKEDRYLNQAYQGHREVLVQQADQMDVPLVSGDYLLPHKPYLVSQVLMDVGEIANMTKLQVQAKPSGTFNTIHIRFPMVLDAREGQAANHAQFNEQVDVILKRLTHKSWSGYKTYTGYFVNMQVASGGEINADIVLHGICTDPQVLQQYDNL